MGFCPAYFSNRNLSVIRLDYSATMADLTEQQKRFLSATGCEVAYDHLTRHLYATDASIYRVKPLAVAFPKTVAEVEAITRAAHECGVPITPRGTGSGVTGGAIGPGLVIDFSRYLKRMGDFDPDTLSIRVEPGLVLDVLNNRLKRHGFVFGPEVATSSRATIGGMVGNDSSGARTLLYGTTADHVLAIEGVLVNGERVKITSKGTEPRSLGERLSQLIEPAREEIARRFSADLPKRWPGYGLDRFIRRGGNPCYIVVGSEGTLVLVTALELRVVHLPRQVGMAVLFFNSLDEALECAPQLVELKPAAVEVVDRILFDQTKGQLQFANVRQFLGLDEFMGECFLIVEVYEEVEDKLATITQWVRGARVITTIDRSKINGVWSLRKAGLSLLTAKKGPKKPVAGIEDTVVRVGQLAEYAQEIRHLLNQFGVKASFYGHAEAGLLHIRPMLDLRDVNDLGKFRAIADAISELVQRYNGSIAGEHGCGMARTEYLHRHLGPELYSVLSKIKSLFDPSGLLNPGKIIDTGVYKIDSHLRMGPGYRISLPFEPQLRFAKRDESFLANLDQCNGCAACRKLTPTMCPTYIATGREEMSTRGRCNTIRAALENQFAPDNPLNAPELWKVLSTCLSCKACTTECPSNVNLPLLKAELLHAKNKMQGLSLATLLFAYIDVVSGLAAKFPSLTNAVLGKPLIKLLMRKLFGISTKRNLPKVSGRKFHAWYERHAVATGLPRTVVLWDDTYVRYYEPEIGISAVRVLNALGYNVVLVPDRKCCGRPAFSQGLLDRAKRLGTHNIRLLSQYPQHIPVIFLEPSCWSMFVDDYIELDVPGAPEVAKRCFLFDQFLAREIKDRNVEELFDRREELIVIHTHCHSKSLADQEHLHEVVMKLPGRECVILNTGCCGMAGAFGMREDNYELSVKIAQPLIEQINSFPPEAKIVLGGTSCRQQVAQLTNRHPLHLAQVFESALQSPNASTTLH